ncbi:thiopeptide maturation pyridine synthase [Streptomyces monomycini]|uniref:thiopeptide maturation pyridine synthase n=1 Tax=Streptomyces monomycini TaxID=371720 RepID=UPI0004AB2AA1|nr:thiopeptide maturation pyridine synthase [Streptomyces monomycini]
MSGASAEWHSIHVHHHDESTEPALVLDAVRPAFEAVRASVDGAWFGRHWLRGPHLRLNFRTTAEEWSSHVRPRVVTALETYVRDHPSTVRLDEDALAPVHERLAELEMETGPRHPWVPDNTVLEQPYDHRLPVLGSMRGSEVLADFLSDTNDLAFAMYEHLRGGGALPVLALDLMWTTASVAAVPFDEGGAPLARGFLSLRSHADAFLSRTHDPAGYRAAFDERYRRQADALTTRLRTVESVLSAEPGSTEAADAGATVPFVREWAEAVRRCQRVAYPLLESGELTLSGAGLAPRLPTRQLSDFHRLLQTDHGHDGFLRDDHWFASFRLVVNYLYIHLNRLGLKPVDRGLLCHLAANTVETVHGVTAEDAFRRHVVSSSPTAAAPEWSRLSKEWADGRAEGAGTVE